MRPRQGTLLQESGLSSHEGEVYAALLRHSPASVSAIERASGLHRPAIYAALAALLSKGLVASVLRGKRKHYAAESPKKLEQLFADRIARFRDSLGEFERAYRSRKTEPSVKLLRGRKGLQSVLEDLTATLEVGDTFYRASSRDLGTEVERYVPRNFRALRNEKKLEQFVITNEALKKSPHHKRIECYSKMIPKSEDPFTYDIAELIYGDKVAFVDYRAEVALLIENPRFARFQERLFRSLFKRL